MREERPDLLAVTGDQVDDFARGLAQAGLTVLVNQAVPLEREGGRLWIAGTGDPAGRSWSPGGGRGAAPDVERTLAGIPADEPVLVLRAGEAGGAALAEAATFATIPGEEDQP